MVVSANRGTPSGLGFGGFPNLWIPFWGLHYKDYIILGSSVGPPNSGK